MNWFIRQFAEQTCYYNLSFKKEEIIIVICRAWLCTNEDSGL